MRNCIKIMAPLLMVAVFGPNGFCKTGNAVEGYRLESITVTAQKKEENARDVPISMDVFSTPEMEDGGIENTFDLTRFSPNVLMKNNYTEHVVVIRGISSFSGSTYSPAGFYVDDVSYSLVHMLNMELFDIERAEVLKGPQGTLYGRNSESGVVNIITRQPGNRFRGKVFGEYGSYNSFRSGVNISGPIARDKLALGTVWQYKSSDGYVDNEFDGNDGAADLAHINGRATLRWTPTVFWDIALIADVMDADDHIGGYRFIDGPQRTDPYKVRKDWREYYEERGNSQTLRAKYAGGRFDFLSVSSVLGYDLDRLADSDLWDDPEKARMSIFKIKERQYSQEFRVSSTRNGPFDWLLGLYGFGEETRFDFKYDFVAKGASIMHPVTDIDSNGLAAFGQGTYTPVERLHLTAGLRLDYHEMEGHLVDSVRKEICRKDMSEEEVMPKFVLAYDVSTAIMAYASASKGYLMGGFNWAMKPTQETFHYDPEYTWNYESGIKATLLDGRLMANLSLFYIDIDDKQVTEYDSNTSTKTIRNAAKAHSQGFELQMKAKPVQGLDLFAGFGYTEAKFDDFIASEWRAAESALVEVDYEDKYLPYAPRYTCNMGIQYRSAKGLFGRVDVFATDRFYGDSANTSKQASYETVNLRIGYEGRHCDLYLWAENLFDEEYLTYVAPYGKHTIGLDGAPQIVGVSVIYRF